MILQKIIESKKAEVAVLREQTSLEWLEETAVSMPPVSNFGEALRSRECAVIAEVKRRSPSGGTLREDLNPATVAVIYEKCGAAAVSVLTDGPFFGGHRQDIAAVKQAVCIPVLRKDFIIDPYQIYEARVMGADALLLITCILSDRQLAEYINLAIRLGMDALVEIHTRDELDRALSAGAGIIGINNRNLDTLATSLNTTLDLAPLVPEGRIIVSESGIAGRKDMEMLMAAGVRAFLIGETLMKSRDISLKLKELLGHDRN